MEKRGKKGVARLQILSVGLFVLCNTAFLFGAKRYLVTDHGAIGDGTNVNTVAIQATIDLCAKSGGGVVVIPKGVFLSGSIFFKPRVSLLIERDGALKGTTNIADYPAVRTRWEGEDREWTAALVNFFDASNVRLNGEGTIDGSGERFPSRRFARSNTNQASTISNPDAAAFRGRPRLIALQNCRNVRVSGLHLKNQASWCLFMLYSTNMVADNLNIRAEHFIPSSDGIDIDSCKGVRVSGCDIDVNDDCISIKSGKDEEGRRVNRPCEDVLIEKTRFAYGHGGVAMGSEVSGGIRNVEVRDCVVEAGNWAPIRFKSQPSRGGVIENIIYRNIEIHDAKQAVEFNLEWRMVPPLAPPAPTLTVVRGVKLIHITGKAGSVGVLHGLKDSPITDVKFERCHLTANKGLVLDHTSNIDTRGLKLEVKEGEAIIDKNNP